MSQPLKLTVLLFLFALTASHGQKKMIYLNNPSFEDQPRKGTNVFVTIKGWTDCGLIYFPEESPPDIHPVDYWQVTKTSSDGNTYLGMVVRDNESWESVSQRLSDELEAGKCYQFSIDLSVSRRYVSPTRRDQTREENFTRPSVLRIWGGATHCRKLELLAESNTIRNHDWETYYFKFEPQKTHRFIVLEAFYKTPVLIPYNGHILLDNASAIKEIECDEEIQVEEEEEFPVVIAKPVPKPTPKPPPVQEEPKENIVEPAPAPKEKILEELDSKKLVEGQTIKIEKLFFEADTSSIGNESFDVLDEIYDFLEDNEKIIVEIGGHTNGLPKHDYCDKLSTARAKEVALYLVRRGVEARRIKYKGYGKRKPIASNHTKTGRKKNQRVEIKILSLDG